MIPAGFARRYAAWSLDAAAITMIAATLAWPLLVPAGQALSATAATSLGMVAGALFDGMMAGESLPAVATGLLHDPRWPAAVAAFRSALWSLAWPFLLAYSVVALPWHAAGVASRWQASPGKRAFGLRVVGPGASRPGAARAIGRHLAAALSWLTLNAGHLMALGGTHAALHDRVAGTRVCRWDGASGRSPSVAAWIAVQGVAVLVSWWWLLRAVAALAAGAA